MGRFRLAPSLALLLLFAVHCWSQNCQCGEREQVFIGWEDCQRLIGVVEMDNEHKSNWQCRNITFDSGTVRQCNIGEDLTADDNSRVRSSKQDNGTIFTINNNGFINGMCYPDQLFCAYTVTCDPGQQLHWQFSRLDIERNLFGDCIDLLTMEENVTNSEQLNCGRVGVNGQEFDDIGIDPTGSVPALERAKPPKLTVSFRSGPNCRNCGYFLNVECIDVNYQNLGLVNCDDATLGRERRNTPVPSHFKPSRPRHHHHHHKIRRFIIPVFTTITYKNNVLRAIRDDATVQVFHNIRYLSVYNESHGLTVYRSNAPRTLFGYGKLAIHKYYRAFYKEILNPPGVIPNDFEREIILLLLEALLPIFASEDYDLISGPLPPTDPPTPLPTPHPTGLPGRVGECLTFRDTGTFPESIFVKRSVVNQDFLALAKQNLNACNPVLRFIAKAVVENR